MSSEFFNVARDLTAGTIGACSGIIAGQPFDTVKVRLQAAAPGVYRGAFQCAALTVRREGFFSLYKGMASPLVGNAPLNAIVFGCTGNAQRILDAQFPSTKAPEDRRPEYWKIYAAATWGGLAQCLVCTPVELVKCQLQVQGMNSGSPAQYKGAWDCVAQIYRRGGLFGLYRGWWSTVWRDAPSYGCWFVANEYVKYQLTPADAKEASTAVLLTAGGLAGIVTWASTYPFDVVKSVVQTLPEGTPTGQLKMAVIARENYQKEGFRWFFRGLGTTLVRAVPVSAVTFYVYEKIIRATGGK